MSTKSALSLLVVVIVLLVAWRVLNDKDIDEPSAERYEQEPPYVNEPGLLTTPAPGAFPETNFEDSEESGARSGPSLVSPDANGSPGSTGLDESLLIPPEGLSGDTSPSVGPAPEAGDTGIMGLPPEAGDTGIMGPAPEAEAILMENPAPEAGQPTDAGLSPEASGPQ